MTVTTTCKLKFCEAQQLKRALEKIHTNYWYD